jgi:hypothetical protein
MDNTKKAKPMEALKLLSEPHRRLVNKLITGLYSGDVDEKTKNCINLCINRSRRANSQDDGRGQYLNGYLFWYKQKFPEMKATGKTITNIGRELGKQWRSLSDAEKEHYNVQARSAKLK